jgi:ferredoxin
MITAERKPLDEILEMIEPYEKILIAGCGTCVTVCFAGGEKEVGVLATELRMARKMAGNPIEIVERTVQRQCEWEYVDPLHKELEDVEAVLSLACGIGVQALAQRFPDVPMLPGVNTTFLGLPEEPGIFVERCAACGNCVLDITLGICPIARCAKNLLNGPCGGSQDGKCEIDEETDCAWQLIYDHLVDLGQVERLTRFVAAKDWDTSRDGGPRKIVREDLMLDIPEEEEA